jgi:serine protease AprX
LTARNVKGYATFPGVAAEITLSQLAAFAQDPDIDAISSDEPVAGSATISGTEGATNSSGAAAALKQFKAAGTGIGVAIIDSGVGKIPDLPNIVYSIDFVDNTTGKHVDGYGHGTQVASLVGSSGAASGPAKTYAGVAPSARLIDVRVLDSLGNGSTSDVIAAIDWVIANQNIMGSDNKPLNIRVINLSLGHLPYEGADTDPLALECRKAVQAGITVVVAAGNYGKDASGNRIYGGILTPGIEPSVITVGAATTWGTPSRADDVVASYSSRGPTIDNIIKPDIVAPGSRIVSDFNPKSYLISNNKDLQVGTAYMALSGTSMSAPIVSGTVAMMLSKVPTLTPNAVKAILMYTAEDRGSPLDWGAGYLNVGRRDGTCDQRESIRSPGDELVKCRNNVSGV